MKMSRRSSLSLPLVVIVAAFVAIGCGDFEELETPETCSAQQALCEAHVFLSVEEFEFLRQNSDPIILDARRELEDFEAQHVPGAHFAHWGEHRGELDSLFDDDEKLQDYIQSIGVEDDRAVIVYGEGDGSGGDAVAGNLYWTLEYVGHDEVYLVDGGLQAWIDARYDALDSGNSEPEATDFEIERRDELLATVDDLKEVIDDEEDDTVIIDTRRESEFVGEEIRNNPYSGKVRTSVHYHWEDVFDDDNTLRDADELKAEFEEVGFAPGVDTVPYCQSGVRSGYFYAVLQSLGYPDPVNYDGSWRELAVAYDEGDISEDYVKIIDEAE